MEEIWKLIDGYDNYKISNLGRVLFRNIKGDWLLKKQFKTKCGYMYIHLSKDGKIKNKGVHCLVAEAFVPGKFPGAEVNHKDLDKLNNCADNLEWVTHAQNQRHQFMLRNKQRKRKQCVFCGKELSKNAKGEYCLHCYNKMVRASNRKNIWPTKEQLSEDLQYMSFLEIGRKYNYSDNNIRKICKTYALPHKKEDVIQYRKKCGTYAPPKNSSKKPLKERYTFYEVAGLSMTATGWSCYLGLDSKRIKRYANKHTYEETVEYITEWLNKMN